MKGCDELLGLQDTLKALADPIRREILNLLKGGRLSAGEICEHFSVTGASISRHLAILKDADLIRSKNSEFVALLKQANTDISKIAEAIGVSDAQLIAILVNNAFKTVQQSAKARNIFADGRILDSGLKKNFSHTGI